MKYKKKTPNLDTLSTDTRKTNWKAIVDNMISRERLRKPRRIFLERSLWIHK